MSDSPVSRLLDICLWYFVNNISRYLTEIRPLPPNIKDRLLKIMSLEGQITDANLSEVLHPDAQALDVENCELSDAALLHVCNCRKLRRLNLNSLDENRMSISLEGGFSEEVQQPHRRRRPGLRPQLPAAEAGQHRRLPGRHRRVPAGAGRALRASAVRRLLGHAGVGPRRAGAGQRTLRGETGDSRRVEQHRPQRILGFHLPFATICSDCLQLGKPHGCRAGQESAARVSRAVSLYVPQRGRLLLNPAAAGGSFTGQLGFPQQEVHMGHCVSLTDAAVEAVFTRCPQMQIFLFHDCPLMTDRSREVLQRSAGPSKLKQVMWTVY